MELTNSQIDSSTFNEALEIASWNRPRSSDELNGFISSREAIVFGL